MNENLYPRRNVGRLYLARKEEGKGLISCKQCVNVKVQSLDKCHRESVKWMLKFEAAERGFSEVEDPDALNKRLREEKTIQWLGKP